MSSDTSALTAEIGKYIASKIKDPEECLDEAVGKTFFMDHDLDKSKTETRIYDEIDDKYETHFILHVRLRQTRQVGIRAIDIRRKIGLAGRNHLRVADRWARYVVNEEFAREFFNHDRNDLYIHIDPSQLETGDVYENEHTLIQLHKLDTSQLLRLINKSVIIDRI